MGTERKETNDPAGVPRRKFLNGFLGSTATAVAAAVIYPVMQYLRPPRIAEAPTNRVLAAKVSELAEKKWKIFPFGSEPGMIIETAPGEYRAFAAMCTHLSCTVQYEEASKRIWCACHNGWYDLSGRNIAGPPPHPLERYEVNVVGEDIFVVRG
jgi:Rieske Fe-S protein